MNGEDIKQLIDQSIGLLLNEKSDFGYDDYVEYEMSHGAKYADILAYISNKLIEDRE